MTDEPPREIELKFEVGPQDLERLRAHRLFKRLRPPERLVSVYWDTPDFKLRREGLSLRIRTTPKKRVQTLKATGDDGPFSRGEWETPVDADQPDLETTRDTPLDAALADDVDRAALGPRFAAVVDRAIKVVREHGAGVEMALDQGEVRAGERSAPIAELELELLRGDPRALYRVAEDLFQIAPLRLSLRTKAESGYALLEEAKDHVAAVDPDLKSGMTCAEALRAIAHTALSHFLPNERLVRRTRGVKAVHQARVALRRLRAALTLFGPLVEDAQSRAIKAAIKDAAATLGKVRDLDVFLERLEGMDLPEAFGVEALANHIRLRRETAADAAVAMLEHPDFAHLTLKLAAWIEAGDWADSDAAQERVDAMAGEQLSRRARRLDKRLKGLRKAGVEGRHKARIAAKKLRYGTEFFQGLGGRKTARRRLEALKPLQEALGALNDLANGQRLLHDIAAEHPVLGFGAGAVAEAFQIQETSALKAAEKAAKRFRKLAA